MSVATVSKEEATLVENIPNLFERIRGTSTFYQEFPDDLSGARKFADHLRETAPNLLEVEQRNTRVLITVLDFP